MKANHNKEMADQLPKAVVVNISISKNESKSQQLVTALHDLFVVVNISISKNESKSQQLFNVFADSLGCGKYQYFKE